MFATQGSNKDAWDAADMTPLRVDARAVKAARRPSTAVEPAVIGFPPGEPKVRRDTKGVVQVRRARPQADPYLAEVAARLRRGRRLDPARVNGAIQRETRERFYSLR